MNKQEIDKIIFSFLKDLKGIIFVKDNYEKNNKCEILFKQATQYLKNENYSDINVRDENGNTFLHYACAEMNKEYILLLLYKGANPFIKNYKEQNCFRISYKPINQGYLNRAIEKEFHNLHLKKFNLLNTLSSEFKNYLFETNLNVLAYDLSDATYKEFKDFLMKNNILNIKNITSLTFKVESMSHENHKSENIINLLEDFYQNTTPEENSNLHINIINNISFLNMKGAFKNPQLKEKVLVFTEEKDFEVNFQLLNSLINCDNYFSSQKNKFIIDYFTLLVEKLANKNIQPQQKFSHENLPHSLNLQYIMDMSETIKTIYSKEKLKIQLNSDSEHKTKKERKIKI